jgi:glutathione S-transferase
MKLYFAPGACSLSPHIVLREAGLPFDLEKVDLTAKRTKSGADYTSVNPKGYVPALELEGGQVLTEGPAIVQYIADQKPATKLAPPAGTMDRYRLQEWLGFISTELHKSITPLFKPNTPDAYKEITKGNVAQRFDVLSKSLQGKDYLMGSTFTVADAYLYTILSWTPHVGIDLGKWPVLKAYSERVGARPAVRAALEAETKARAA